MITYEMSVAEGGQIHWIQSVYVVAEARNQGVFRTIFDSIVQEAKKDPLVKGVRLYVDHDNETAMAVYSKLGMTQLSNYNFDEADFVLGKQSKL